jgi:predicted component of type VI protein secretion system
MSQILVPVSLGELIDKITILEIKAERIDDSAKLVNIRRELEQLLQVRVLTEQLLADIADVRASLKEVNYGLWDIEDRIRIKESLAEFDDEFIELARSVYIRNDERAKHKRTLSTREGFELVEEKSYASYKRVDA